MQMAEPYEQDAEVLGSDRPEPAQYIHAAVMFADIENSVLLSALLDPLDFDALMQAFQELMLQVAENLKRQGLPVGEVRIIGDQLAIFFYDPAEIERNRQLDGYAPLESANRADLIHQCRESNNALAYGALRAAIQTKNAWLTHAVNQHRLRNRAEPIGLGIGIHTGRVFLRERPGGGQRIEGYTLNFAHRVQTFARNGRYSRIMCSQDARNIISSIVVRHSQLSQRVYFHQHEASFELLKGVPQSQQIYELRFFSRLGLQATDATVDQYEALFFQNHNNIWAYYQVFEYHAYDAGNWERVFELASKASLVHPRDEKVLLDLARYHSNHRDFTLAEKFALSALAINPSFDLAYELLAVIARETNDPAAELHYMAKAVQLAPRSPINRYNLGCVLCAADRLEEGARHIQYALDAYPGLREDDADRELLDRLEGAGLLTVAVF
jgi:class 3 adenylate cyclase